MSQNVGATGPVSGLFWPRRPACLSDDRVGDLPGSALIGADAQITDRRAFQDVGVYHGLVGNGRQGRSGLSFQRVAWLCPTAALSPGHDSVDLLAATAPSLAQAIEKAAVLVWVILDGTLIPIDRVADQKPYYCGKHKRNGVTPRSSQARAATCCGPHPCCPDQPAT
jgi:hypothetical protein